MTPSSPLGYDKMMMPLTTDPRRPSSYPPLPAFPNSFSLSLSQSLHIDPITSTVKVHRDYCPPRQFTFDRVLPPFASQGAVFDASVNSSTTIIDDTFKGLSGGVLCYGQTGAGKTFTMFGDMGDDVVVEDCQVGPPKETGSHMTAKVRATNLTTWLGR